MHICLYSLCATHETFVVLWKLTKDSLISCQLTAGGLIELYETCVKPLRKAQSQRRINSLKQIHPVNFTKEVC